MVRMTTSVAVIVDAAAYAQAVEDAVKASAAYYTGGTSVLDDDTCQLPACAVFASNGVNNSPATATAFTDSSFSPVIPARQAYTSFAESAGTCPGRRRRPMLAAGRQFTQASPPPYGER